MPMRGGVCPAQKIISSIYNRKVSVCLSVTKNHHFLDLRQDDVRDVFGDVSTTYRLAFGRDIDKYTRLNCILAP